jgi:TonB-dependent receptor
MVGLSRSFRFILCATTVVGLGATAARAQTAAPPTELNLGSVVATGGAQPGGGPVSPSATGSLRQAHKLVKLAHNVLSVQPQSQMQKYPDVNVAESLQRLPGVSLETDTGEGRFVNIRGLDADLNGTTFDGVHLTASNQSTPTGGARAVAFDAFPEGLVGGVEVVKSLTPDMEAEGLGGNVNLLPLTLPAGGGLLANISAAGGEEVLRDTGIYSFDANVGTSFAIPGMRSFANDKPFSVILDYTSYSDRRGIDDVEEDYNSPTNNNQPASLQDLQFRHYDGHRVRQGFGGELDFNPSPTTDFYIRALQGGYDEQLDKNRLELDGLDGSGTDQFGNDGTLTDHGGGNYTATGATAQKDFTNSNERIGNDLIVLGGKTVVDDLATVDYRGSWTEGYDIVARSYGTKFKDGTPFTVNYSTASSEYRTYSIPEGIDLADPALYDLHSASNTPGRTFDQEFNAAADVSVPTSIAGNLGVAKFGAEARLRSEGSFQLEYDYNDLNKDATLAELDGGNAPEVYYNSHYNIGPDVAYEALDNALGAPTQNQETTIGSFAHNTENVYAAYAQDTTTIGPVEILAGARMEDTNGTYRAYTTTNNADGSTSFTPNTNRQDYINVFPSVQAKYTINDSLQLRATYSTGIARPGFDQISAAQNVTIGGGNNGENAVSEGNPSLKPTTGNSFDFTTEYYTPYDGLLLINPFYKLFSNYVVATQSEGVYQGAPAQIDSYQNIGGAFARGIEIDGEQKFGFLPGALNGFGVDANATFVDSRGLYDPGEKANELPETSPISYNASLFYEKGPASFRLAASYVSRNLFAVVGTRDTDQFSSPRFRLDVSGSLQATPRMQVYIEGKNLTNTLLEFTQSASSAYPIQREFYDAEYLVGVRFNLGTVRGGGGSEEN